MPSCPGVWPVIAHAQAGTVMGGVMLARSPYIPFSISFAMVGTSARRSSNRSVGVAQSSPMTATLGPCCMSFVPLRSRSDGRTAGALAPQEPSAVRVSYKRLWAPSGPELGGGRARDGVLATRAAAVRDRLGRVRTRDRVRPAMDPRDLVRSVAIPGLHLRPDLRHRRRVLGGAGADDLAPAGRRLVVVLGVRPRDGPNGCRDHAACDQLGAGGLRIVVLVDLRDHEQRAGRDPRVRYRSGRHREADRLTRVGCP